MGSNLALILKIGACAVLALAGVVVIIAGARTRLRAGVRRCQKCWYELGPSVEGVCPECGTPLADEDSLWRGRSRAGIIVTGVLLILAGAGVLPDVARYRAAWYAVLPKWKTAEEYSVNGYTIRLERVRNPDGFGEQVEILRGGDSLWTVEGFRMKIAGVVPPAAVADPGAAFIDLTGNGVPDLVIEDWSGGAHCCTSYSVIELGSVMRVLGTIDTGNVGTWKRSAVDNTPVVLFGDAAWDYWQASHAESHLPAIYLRWDGRRFSPSLQDMAAPCKPDQDLLAEAAAVPGTAPYDTRPNPELWARMLDLTYTGHKDKALLFARGAWKPAWGDLDAWLRGFEENLAKSPYRGAIEDLQRIGDSPTSGTK